MENPMPKVTVIMPTFEQSHFIRRALDNLLAQYASMRARPATAPRPGALTILLVGELAYNAERVRALEEQGHALYGLWMDEPYWYNTVGPLPFGPMRDVPREGWVDAVHALRPDVIYAQLNWQAVPFCHQDGARMQALRENVRRARHLFTFDQHAQALVEFFRTVIDHAGRLPAPTRSAA